MCVIVIFNFDEFSNICVGILQQQSEREVLEICRNVCQMLDVLYVNQNVLHDMHVREHEILAFREKMQSRLSPRAVQLCGTLPAAARRRGRRQRPRPSFFSGPLLEMVGRAHNHFSPFFLFPFWFFFFFFFTDVNHSLSYP